MATPDMIISRWKMCIRDRAGITDRAFREMLHRMGAGLVYTEMVSDMALVYQNKATLAMLNLTGEARPIAVQLRGSDPEVMAKAAKLIAARAVSYTHL